VIGRLRGTVVAKSQQLVVLDVSGVGYEVAVSPRALVELPGLGEEAVLHTHLHVREDQLALFGFPTEDDRSMFRLLLGASGVGPKVALAILATFAPSQLRAIVLAEDASALTSVPGIGHRSAQKLLLELRSKLELPDGGLPSTTGAVADLREALEALGYQSGEIRSVVQALPADLPLEELLRLSLRELDRNGRSG